MHRIQYLTDGRTINIGSDTTLLRAALDHGIAHTHVCGGNAKCSTCRVCEPRIRAYAVEAENFESIHNHSAFARVVRRSGHATAEAWPMSRHGNPRQLPAGGAA